MTSVRVKNMSEELVTHFAGKFPQTPLKVIYGGMTVIDVPHASSEQLAEILQFLREHNVQEFTFGKVTLNDLYAMYYHELVLA